jgi:hypothetical protein
MGAGPWRRCLASTLAGLLIVGCSRPPIRKPEPPDPLFQSKKPAEGKPADVKMTLSRPEPVPPAQPSAVWTPAREDASVSSGETETTIRRMAWDSSARRPGTRLWLQGRVERALGRRIYLIPEGESRQEGKLLLEADPRLDQFQDGDLIRVDAETLREADTGNGWVPYPRFRVHGVHLLRRGS